MPRKERTDGTASRGSRLAKMATVDRIILADLFVNSVSRKVAKMEGLSESEREAVRAAARLVKAHSENWKTSGRVRGGGKVMGRDALYNREYRARLALEYARERGASRGLLDRLRAEHREAEADYNNWKAHREAEV